MQPPAEPTITTPPSSVEHSRSSHSRKESGNGYLATLTLGALGVVFGDIGTSPLYAVRECFYGSHGLTASAPHVLGVMSLILWSLLIIIGLDYLLFIMRADNKGEGGEFALMALLSKRTGSPSSTKLVVMLGLAGAALLYGDGMITPAISVLSAVEGLRIVTPALENYIEVIAVTILVGLFMIQSRGTARVGAVFGPVILVWFLVLGLLGLRGLMFYPGVLAAINPLYAIEFLLEMKLASLVVLGSVFLVVTGGEALFADMGHFGRTPIRLAWFLVVLPCLMLNYLGQGALLMAGPEHVLEGNPFFSLAPGWARLPLVALATLATVIASQAVIAGAFSLTRQAVQLGYLPRLEIMHTSSDEIGQIYVSKINWALLIANIWLVLEFHSSSSLAAAYGFAVATTMVITSILMFFVARDIWRWNMWIAGIGWVLIMAVKLVFFSAQVLKIPHGGWFPLLMGAIIMLLMLTWRRGREILAERLSSASVPMQHFVHEVQLSPPQRVPGTAVFMGRSIEGTPTALIHNLTHNKVLHEQVVLMVIVTEDIPYVDRKEQLAVQPLGAGFYRVTARYGFMETPNVPRLIRRCREHGLDIDMTETTFFLGRETLIATRRPGMAIWRERLFAFMSRNSQRATHFFKIPPDQVIEIGLQVEL